jgi:hypothetical protein
MATGGLLFRCRWCGGDFDDLSTHYETCYERTDALMGDAEAQLGTKLAQNSDGLAQNSAKKHAGGRPRTTTRDGLPWLREGVSRRTWYRKKLGEAS